MDENVVWQNRLLLEKTSEKLIKNGFKDTFVVDSSDQARQMILELIKDGSKVGFGGSMTIKHLKIKDELKQKNIEIIVHKPQTPIQERREIWRKAFFSDFYLASPQAITYSGKLFFIDMYGNRTSAIVVGPQRVILVCGYNKLVPDDENAFWRIQNISGVQNAHRLNKKTPCTITGICSECNSTERICNVITILCKRPGATDYTIILVNEHLGY